MATHHRDGASVPQHHPCVASRSARTASAAASRRVAHHRVAERMARRGEALPLVVTAIGTTFTHITPAAPPRARVVAGGRQGLAAGISFCCWCGCRLIVAFGTDMGGRLSIDQRLQNRSEQDAHDAAAVGGAERLGELEQGRLIQGRCGVLLVEVSGHYPDSFTRWIFCVQDRHGPDSKARFHTPGGHTHQCGPRVLGVFDGHRYSAVMAIPTTRPLGPAVAGWSDFRQVMAISWAARWRAVRKQRAMLAALIAVPTAYTATSSPRHWCSAPVGHWPLGVGQLSCSSPSSWSLAKFSAIPSGVCWTGGASSSCPPHEVRRSMCSFQQGRGDVQQPRPAPAGHLGGSPACRGRALGAHTSASRRSESQNTQVAELYTKQFPELTPGEPDALGRIPLTITV